MNLRVIGRLLIVLFIRSKFEEDLEQKISLFEFSL